MVDCIVRYCCLVPPAPRRSERKKLVPCAENWFSALAGEGGGLFRVRWPLELGDYSRMPDLAISSRLKKARLERGLFLTSNTFLRRANLGHAYCCQLSVQMLIVHVAQAFDVLIVKNDVFYHNLR